MSRTNASASNGRKLTAFSERLISFWIEILTPDEIEALLRPVPHLFREYTEAMHAGAHAKSERGKALHSLRIALHVFHELAERAGLPKSEFKVGQTVVLVADYSGDSWDMTATGVVEKYVGQSCVILGISHPDKWELGIPTYPVTFEDGALTLVSELELKSER